MQPRGSRLVPQSGPAGGYGGIGAAAFLLYRRQQLPAGLECGIELGDLARAAQCFREVILGMQQEAEIVPGGKVLGPCLDSFSQAAPGV